MLWMCQAGNKHYEVNLDQYKLKCTLSPSFSTQTAHFNLGWPQMSKTQHAVSSWIYPNAFGSLNGFLSVIDVTSCLWPQGWGAFWSPPTIAPPQQSVCHAECHRVICFCQKLRNIFLIPGGVVGACVPPGGMCFCCDYLPLQRKGFLSGPWKNAAPCQTPWAAPQMVPGSVQRATVSTLAGDFPAAEAWAAVTSANSKALTLRAHIPLL